MEQSERLSDLQQFTKAELIYYLTQVEVYLPSCLSPKACILEKRLDDVDAQIKTNLQESGALNELYKNKQISDMDYLLQRQKLNREWWRLNRKQDKIENELYPREIS